MRNGVKTAADRLESGLVCLAPQRLESGLVRPARRGHKGPI